MKRKYLSGTYLVAASALTPQAVFAHGGVDGESIIVTVLHSLAHLAGNLSAPGLIAIGLVAIRGGFMDLVSRWFRSLQTTVTTRKLTYFAPEATSTAGGGLPFAVAMGFGAVAYQAWGMPWF